MAGILKLREEVHNRILKMRSLEALILRPQFERLWESSSEILRQEARVIISLGNREGLLAWIQSHPSLDLAERSTKELKEVARKLGISNWSRLSKLELLIAIQRKEENHAGGNEAPAG
jgi:hypothetical protein